MGERKRKKEGEEGVGFLFLGLFWMLIVIWGLGRWERERERI